MTDFTPPVARGERAATSPAPPRPDEDERWDYIADHLRAIRASLAVLALAAAMSVIGGVLLLFMQAAN